MGIRAAEIFFEPLQLHLELADLLEQISFLGLALAAVVALHSADEQLTGAIQAQPLPLALLDGANGVISGDLPDRVETTDRLHVDSGFKFGTVGAARDHRWEHPSGAMPRLRG